jgi:hypothetical protein
VIWWSPTASVVAERVAMPLLVAVVPSEVAPSKNSTSPVGLSPVTVADHSLAVPTVADEALARRAVVVAPGITGAAVTVTEVAPEVEGALFVSPA